MAETDTPLSKVVRGQLDIDTITRDETDKIAPHATANMGDDNMTIFELDSKLGIRQRLNDFAGEFNHFLLTSHKLRTNYIKFLA